MATKFFKNVYSTIAPACSTGRNISNLVGSKKSSLRPACRRIVSLNFLENHDNSRSITTSCRMNGKSLEEEKVRYSGVRIRLSDKDEWSDKDFEQEILSKFTFFLDREFCIKNKVFI